MNANTPLRSNRRHDALTPRLRSILFLTRTATALLAATAVLVQVAPPPGAIAWWSGEGDATDSVGDNTGVIQGDLAFTPGVAGDAFDLDGTSGFMEIANTPAMDFGTGDFTITAWLRFRSLADDQTILHTSVGVVPADQAYYLEFNLPNLLRFAVRDTETNVNDLTVTASLKPGTWYLVAAVRAGSTNLLYLNGTLVGAQVAGRNVDTGTGGNARIGRLASNGITSVSRFCNGAIDEVSLFSRALAGTDIQALFNSASLRPLPSSLDSIGFQGILHVTDGQPLADGPYRLTFKFYDVPVSGRVLGASMAADVAVSDGVASTTIPVDASWFDGGTRYLGASINDGAELAPRVLVTSVPYAVRARSLMAPSPFDSVSGVQQQQGLELRWYQNTPFIDFTRSPNPGRDFDYRIHVTSPEDPRFVIGSDIAQNGIVIRRNGFVGIGGPFPERELDVQGTTRTTVLQITSAREAKQGFAPVDAAAILAKVAALPLSSWAYTNAPTVRHLGPVAQDFHAAFVLGDDDKHIATVDADGVALAAIQGLHQLLQEKEARLALLESAVRAKDTRIATLETRLTALERTIECRLSVVEETAPGPKLRPFGDPWPPQPRTER